QRLGRADARLARGPGRPGGAPVAPAAKVGPTAGVPHAGRPSGPTRPSEPARLRAARPRRGPPARDHLARDDLHGHAVAAVLRDAVLAADDAARPGGERLGRRRPARLDGRRQPGRLPARPDGRTADAIPGHARRAHGGRHRGRPGRAALRAPWRGARLGADPRCRSERGPGPRDLLHRGPRAARGSRRVPVVARPGGGLPARQRRPPGGRAAALRDGQLDLAGHGPVRALRGHVRRGAARRPPPDAARGAGRHRESGRDRMTQAPVGFDLDLTLIDSRQAILQSFAGLAADTGVAIDLAAVTSRLGIKLEAELAYWFPPGEIAEAVRRYRTHYLRLSGPLTTQLPGAAEALEAVRAAGARVVVITAKYKVTARMALEGVGLSADELYADAHGPEKGLILKTIGAAAYVGDTPA